MRLHNRGMGTLGALVELVGGEGLVESILRSHFKLAVHWFLFFCKDTDLQK